MNIAELLKYAPKGMKLYSPIFGECELDYIYSSPTEGYQIEVVKNGLSHFFTNEGRYKNFEEGECMLFPSKECLGWDIFAVQNDFGTPVLFTDEENPKLSDFRLGIHKGFRHIDIGEYFGCEYKIVIPFENFDPVNIEESLKCKL